MTIDEFMRSKGFISQTGYIGESQKKQFGERLAKLSKVRKIAEIGFNAGHSAECFFENCKDLEVFVSFDINHFSYTKPLAEFFQNLHQNRFFFIEGDSQIKVPEFARYFPSQKFDLIYIDGNHEFENVIGDILNARLLSHQNTILWLDDYNYSSVYQAIRFCESIGAILRREVFAPKDLGNRKRTWIEAKYA